MFLHKGKEYYPLEVSQMLSKNKKVIYDRNARNKSYVYLVIENTENKGEMQKWQTMLILNSIP